MKITHLEKKILAVVRTTVMNHNKVWLHYLSLVTQLNESRHRVLPCKQIKGHHQMNLDNAQRKRYSTQGLIFMMNIFCPCLCLTSSSVLKNANDPCRSFCGLLQIQKLLFLLTVLYEKIDCKNSSENSVYCLCKNATLWKISVLWLICYGFCTFYMLV